MSETTAIATLPTVSISFEQMQQMAKAVTKSQLFACRTEEAALTLMLLCSAEGLHPIQAMRMYHIIEGRPAMRADAMQAKFQQAGGKVKWLERTNTAVAAEFTPIGGGPGITIKWTMEDAKKAGLDGRKMYQTYPRQMLSARVISEGIRTVNPEIVVGLYTPEENEDMGPRQVQSVVVEAPVIDATKAPANAGQVAENLLADDGAFVKQAKTAALARGITAEEFETGFEMMLSQLEKTVPELTVQTRDVIIRAIENGKSDKWKGGGAVISDEDKYDADRIAKLSATEFRAMLREHAKPYNISRQVFESGVAKYLAAIGPTASLGDLTGPARMELLECITANIFDYQAGKIPAAAGA